MIAFRNKKSKKCLLRLGVFYLKVYLSWYEGSIPSPGDFFFTFSTYKVQLQSNANKKWLFVKHPEEEKPFF
jgi:hypothetical protein